MPPGCFPFHLAKGPNGLWNFLASTPGVLWQVFFFSPPVGRSSHVCSFWLWLSLLLKCYFVPSPPTTFSPAPVFDSMFIFPILVPNWTPFCLLTTVHTSVFYPHWCTLWMSTQDAPPSLAPEPGAPGARPSPGYPGHQNRVSVEAPGRWESWLVPWWTNPRATPCMGKGGPRCSRGWG